ncbi:alkaline shock response membrane anchor protein AmaP [Streptomyces zaomyceticus]|uniref:alkaline shock response membrane anchor protein AmaP n=1 Tax=Streptomyces zaomyceticus TaxID=68286 RepID=UPI00364E2A04
MTAARSKVNRCILALVGAAAVLAGGWTALTGLARRGTVSWAPPGHPGEWLRQHEPSTAVTMGLPAVVTAAALWWCLAQLRTTGPSTLGLPGAGTRVNRRSLARAIAADLATVPGVDTARVVLRGTTADLRATVALRLATHAEPADVIRLVTQGPLRRARTATGVRLGTDLRLTTPSHRARRAR